MTVHFVYVHGEGIDTTTGIARETIARLRGQHDIVLHHPNDPAMVRPQAGDILIGHPSRHGECFFRRSFAQPGWARRIVLAPFSHAVLTDAALIDDLVDEADLHLAISNPYWIDSMPNTAVSHWHHKTMTCPLGVNRAHFPPIRSRFNPPGMRRFLYIGNADMLKGGDRLARLADAIPDMHFGWIRTGDSRHCLSFEEDPATPAIRAKMQASRLNEHPYVDWRRPDGMRVVASYDFFIIRSRSDALPCEVLEAASYGLVPLTTPECGFAEDDWMTHFSGDDDDLASAVIHRMQYTPEAELLARQAAGRARLESTFNWGNLAKVIEHSFTCPIPQRPDNPEWQIKREANRKILRRIAAQAARSDKIAKLRQWPERIAARLAMGRR